MKHLLHALQGRLAALPVHMAPLAMATGAAIVETLRPHCARNLWAGSDRLEAQRPAACELRPVHHGAGQGDKVSCAYRLYLAGSALGLEQCWMAVHHLLATRLNGDTKAQAMPGAQSG